MCMLMIHYQRIMCEKSVEMSAEPRSIRLHKSGFPNGDIYRVHNSYSFMMMQICKKNRYIIDKFLFTTPILVATFVTKPTQIIQNHAY